MVVGKLVVEVVEVVVEVGMVVVVVVVEVVVVGMVVVVVVVVVVEVVVGMVLDKVVVVVGVVGVEVVVGMVVVVVEVVVVVVRMVVVVEEVVVVVGMVAPHMVGVVEVGVEAHMDLLVELAELVVEHRFRFPHLAQLLLVVPLLQLGAYRQDHRCWPSNFAQLGLGLHHQPHLPLLLRSHQRLVVQHHLEQHSRRCPCLELHPCLE